MNARQKGYEAYKRYGVLAANPYKFGSDDWKEFWSGCADAAKELREPEPTE